MSDDCRYCFSDNWYYTLDFSVLWLRPRCFRFRSINLRLIIHFYFVSLQTQPATSLSPDPEPKTHLNLLKTQKAIFWAFISIKTHIFIQIYCIRFLVVVGPGGKLRWRGGRCRVTSRWCILNFEQMPKKKF